MALNANIFFLITISSPRLGFTTCHQRWYQQANTPGTGNTDLLQNREESNPFANIQYYLYIRQILLDHALPGFSLFEKRTSLDSPASASKIRILIVMGVSGSGKSTVGEALAKELNWSFIEGDQFHSRENVAKMSAGTPLSDEDRSDWLDSLKSEMERLLKEGEGAVVACSALKASYRTLLKIDNRVQFVFLNISFQEAKNRLKGRKGHFMPASLLQSQFETLEQPEGDESINVDAQQAPDRIVTEVVAKLQNQIS